MAQRDPKELFQNALREEQTEVQALARRLRDQDQAARATQLGRDPGEDPDLDPRYVERAMRLYRGQQVERERRDQEDKLYKAYQTSRTRAVGGLVVTLGALLGLGVSGLSYYGANRLSDAQTAVYRAETDLERGLTAQLELAGTLQDVSPQANLGPLITQTRAGPLPDRIDGARALVLGMHHSLSGFTALPDGSSRAQVERQVIDSADRVDQLTRDWEAARVAWIDTASSTPGRLAIALNLADPLPPDLR